MLAQPLALRGQLNYELIEIVSSKNITHKNDTKDKLMKKTAIIVGASSEIGQMTAKKLAKEGFSLALTYNQGKIDFENEIVLKKDCQMKTYQLNLTETGKIKNVFSQIFKDFAYINTLVFCAGVAQKRALILDVKDDEIDNLFEVNTKSAIKCIRHFCKAISGKHPASIVLVGSFVQKFGCSCESVYVATKSALTGLCKSLATELGNLDVRINVVAPGFIDTKMNNNLSASEKQDIAEMTPLKRLGKTCDVANAINFLTSEDANFITGQTIFVDGGLILE